MRRTSRSLGLSAALALAGLAVAGCGGGAEAEERPAKSSPRQSGAASARPAPVTEKAAPPAETLDGAARVVRPEIAPEGGESVGVGQPIAESFGKENVSHGCIGMSTSDAKWLYGLSRKGDVVQVTGGPGTKPMDRFGNGYGDWNLSWAEWLEGSALGVRTG